MLCQNLPPCDSGRFLRLTFYVQTMGPRASQHRATASHRSPWTLPNGLCGCFSHTSISSQTLSLSSGMQFSTFRVGKFLPSSSVHLKCQFLFEVFTEISRVERLQSSLHSSPAAHITLCPSKPKVSVPSPCCEMLLDQGDKFQLCFVTAT